MNYGKMYNIYTQWQQTGISRHSPHESLAQDETNVTPAPQVVEDTPHVFESHADHIFLKYLADLLGIYWSKGTFHYEMIKTFIKSNTGPGF